MMSAKTSTTQQTTFPRWIPLLGGLLGSTTCGLLLYAFSVFVKPLQKQFGWTVTEVVMAYAICTLIFGLITFPAGRWSDKFGPRKIVLIGGAILVFGFFMVSTITTKWELYLYYGVFAGLGGGMIYLPPIALAPRWWPDRKAMATGFTVVGLGLGSFIMGPLATKLMLQFGGALPVFKVVSIPIAILIVLAALCLKVPPAGWKPAGWNPPAPSAGGPKVTRDYTNAEAKKTPQFWLLYVAYFCGSFAGAMALSTITPLGIEAMTKAYQTAHGAVPPADVAKTIAMSAAGAVSAYAALNALTRLLMGPIADKVGTKICLLGVFALQVVAMLALFPVGSNATLLLLVAALLGWNYGAMFTLFPATTVSYYGPTAQGANYGLLFTAWGLASFAGTIVGGMLRDSTGSYSTPFYVGAAVVAVAVIAVALLKPPAKLSA